MRCEESRGDELYWKPRRCPQHLAHSARPVLRGTLAARLPGSSRILQPALQARFRLNFAQAGLLSGALVRSLRARLRLVEQLGYRSPVEAARRVARLGLVVTRFCESAGLSEGL